MNVDIFIPVRLDSARLLKKYLEKINNMPLIEHLVNRLKKAKNFQKIVICTTDGNSDYQLVNFLKMVKNNLEWLKIVEDINNKWLKNYKAEMKNLSSPREKTEIMI